MTEEGQGGEGHLRIHLPPELRGGVWANFALVSHSPYEFTIDFARIDFAQASSEGVPTTVVARINLSPLMVTQLMDALGTNWQNYAEKALPKEVQDDGSVD